ncbi:chromosome partitioning protein ParA [Yersinia hibernica]|uniref:Chromosome partitioning protein ParA n=1 Tax=Yersinia enterocolitica LC20 TaxID=1443113 RepID=A0A7U4GIK2_YEREN|nr:chromosome partitioning protein ParA [Yersinia hibernica]AHM76165.1 chromosome partitioning protein ParA [Yersinia hibernica]OVZ84784.1 chromosome partitioning protein ParA [Yersinia kristensenii]
MSENDPIQYMLGDLQGRYSQLNSGLNKLKDYQQYIELLQQRAVHDSKAREALSRLDAAFPNGFQQEKTKMLDCISQMSIQFKQLETQLKNINATESKLP